MTDLDWLDDPPPAGNWRRDRPRTTDPTRHSTRRTTMTTTVRGLALLAAALVWALIMIAGIALIATPSRGDSCGILLRHLGYVPSQWEEERLALGLPDVDDGEDGGESGE